MHYNYGLGQETKVGARAWSHSGSAAAFRSQVAYFPDHDLGVAVVMNGPCGQGPGAALDAVARLWIPDAEKASEQTQPTNPGGRVPSRVAESLQGWWQVDLDAVRDPETAWLGTWGGSFRLENREGRLMLVPRIYPGMYAGRAKPEPVEMRWAKGDTLVPERGGGASYRVRRDASGAVTALQKVDPPHRLTVGYQRVVPVAPSDAQLAEYVGDYRNPEMDITYRISVEQGRLTLSSVWEVLPTASFEPMSRDRFETASRHFSTMLFERDPNGRPGRIRLQSSALANLVLERLE